MMESTRSPAASTGHCNNNSSQYTQLHATMQLGSDAPRKQFRDSLLSYFQALPPAPLQHTDNPLRWALATTTSTPGEASLSVQPKSTKLLVGDAPSLMATLHDFTEQCRTLSEICHSTESQPTPKNLEWLKLLTRPATFISVDTDPTGAGLARVLDLLRLRDACAPPTQPPATPFDALPNVLKREHAFQLARELPFFDRDITAYYMQPILAANPSLPEYELHVAHSILRLSPPSTTLEHFTDTLFPAWREQGLLHVLTTITANMPCPIFNWSQPKTAEPLATLLKTLPLARSYEAATKSIAHFISHSHPDHTTAAISHTLDTAAVLMRIKSDAPLSNPKAHSLDESLSSFPRPEQCTLDPDLLPQLWASIKPAIERSLPPSWLLAQPNTSTVW